MKFIPNNALYMSAILAALDTVADGFAFETDVKTHPFITKAEAKEWISAQRDSKIKRAAKDKERRDAKKGTVEDPLLDLVRDTLSAEEQSIATIFSKIGSDDITQGKIQNRLTKLVNAGIATKEDKKTEAGNPVKVYKLA